MPDYIPLKCNKCGSPYFEIPENPQPDDAVRCHYCGGRVVIYLIEGFEGVPHPVCAAGVGHALARSPTAVPE